MVPSRTLVSRPIKAESFDSDSSDESEGSNHAQRRQGKANQRPSQRSRKAVVHESDSDEEMNDAEEADQSRDDVDDEVEDDEDEDEDMNEEESDEEADATIIEASLPAQRPARKVKSRQSDDVDTKSKSEVPGSNAAVSVLETPKKASSSEADYQALRLPPRTPEHPLPLDSARSASSRHLMTPHTPRPASVAATPASQARLATNGVPTAPKIRLVIHKMVLRDFKSYAGEQIIGPFHKSFSAVVGPNGSGKSNVIDAMLFVFGWRANKMRQGKLSELIHNSAGREHIPNCSVEVWFREIVDLPGPDDFKVVPNSKLIVARTAYRNNSSVYTLNGKKSNFTEVTTLLKTRGIDLDHKRFLILQGEVESIAQMPPKAKNEHEEGLLEYLEDIIGTSSYKTPIEEASKKVDEANELRGERLARLKIVQKERDSLESKKREAEGYLRDQNELAQRQSALWQVYMLECRDEIEIASSSMEKLEKQIEAEREKNSGSKAEIEALEKQFKQVNAEYDSIAKETDKVVKELSKYEKEDVQLQEKRKHLETKKKKLIKSMNDDKHASSEARSTLANSSEEIEVMQREVKKLESSFEKEESELDCIRDSLKGKTEQFSMAIEQKQKELQPWSAKISAKKKVRDVAVEEKRLLSDKFGQSAKEAEQAQKALNDLKEASEDKREELKRLLSERDQQVEKAANYEREIQGMEKQEVALRNKASSSRVKCEDAKASMQSNRSRGDVLSTLSRQAALGLINGFHGRLGSLGIIDDKYDVAISTACPGLDNIVVEGVEHGQACIEHLRKNNLGRANFILLHSLAKMNLSPIQTPENVPRLFDLVKPKDGRFAPAFYHQLRDTLVARDLVQANRIAYGAQRWRVVTLDGQLIDKSGTMSGGGTRVARGAMSSKAFAQEVTLEQLSKLDKERLVDEETLKNHTKYTHDMRSMLEACKRRIPEIDVAKEKVEMDQGNSLCMIQEAERRIRELQLQSGAGDDDDDDDDGDARRIEELEEQIRGLDAEIEKLSKTSSLIESDIAALQEKILEAGGVELRAQKSKVDGIKERTDLMMERMTKAEVAKTKAEKDLIKLTKNTEKNSESLESMESELQQLLQLIQAKSQSVDNVKRKVEESQDEMESKKEIKDEIKEKLDSLLEGANAFRSLEMEIKQKLEDNEKSKSENEKRLKHWMEKHGKLELQAIDSDEDDGDGDGDGDDAGEEQSKESEEDKSKVEGKVKEREEEEEEEGEEENDAMEQDGDVVMNNVDHSELQEFSTDELRSMNKESIKAEIVIYEEKLQKGQGNLSVLQEYKKRDQEFLSRAKDLEQTTQERDEAKRMHDDLRKQRLESFMAGFAIISSKLKEMYQTITLGGNAELELVDSLDPFSEGILFSVMPPKKSWKNISNLSGGEKTLSSLALVFALHAFKPTPLYAMDELDAALDFRNVSIVANLIKERTKGAQFIVISLRNNMFELASRLVGIYKTNGQTKSLAVHNSDLHALPPPPPPPPIAAGGTTTTSMHPPPSVSRQSQVMATPRPTPVPRGSVPLSMTTPSSQSQHGQVAMTIRKSGVPTTTSSSVLSTPAHHGFTQIPQTPKTGMIKGLGISSSSLKLTSSQSIRGDFASKLGHAASAASSGSHNKHTNNSNSSMLSLDRSTPLATRRPN